MRGNSYPQTLSENSPKSGETHLNLGELTFELGKQRFKSGKTHLKARKTHQLSYKSMKLLKLMSPSSIIKNNRR